MFCKKCGYGVEEGMRFCTRCGAAVEMEEAQKSTVQMQPAGSVQSAFAPAASKTAPEQKKTSDPVQPKEFIQAAKKASAAPAKKPSVLPFVLPAAGLLLLSIILFAIFGPKKELSAEAAAEDGTARTAAVVNKPSGKPSEAAETAEE